ncbi:hypothetical protein O181_131417 [Austropuccinia psidii MF-1]|uniref:Uncharacterized protein n=1 Tax=Austropuccinia psidii MF-1 TaxID=1389203 RepID=A0A9Q3L308_9BASI|nr:hypothetical protein [Austropuccinia psidii MF-1]
MQEVSDMPQVLQFKLGYLLQRLLVLFKKPQPSYLIHQDFGTFGMWNPIVWSQIGDQFSEEIPDITITLTTNTLNLAKTFH